MKQSLNTQTARTAKLRERPGRLNGLEQSLVNNLDQGLNRLDRLNCLHGLHGLDRRYQGLNSQNSADGPNGLEEGLDALPCLTETAPVRACPVFVSIGPVSGRANHYRRMLLSTYMSGISGVFL